MSRELRPSPSSFLRNFTSGSYGPIQRVRLAIANVRRKSGGRGCCGNYGEPGCWMTKDEARAAGLLK